VPTFNGIRVLYGHDVEDIVETYSGRIQCLTLFFVSFC